MKMHLERSRNTTGLVFQKKYYESELSPAERMHINEAEGRNLIKVSRAGNSYLISFLPVTKETLSLLPTSLIHVTQAEIANVILAKGIKAREGKVYLQSPELKVEPEGVSLENGIRAQININTEKLFDSGAQITLDPESLHGIPDEYMHILLTGI